MKDMTMKQAQAEAIRRWGERAVVRFRPPRPAGIRGRFARYCCTVGNGLERSLDAVEGQGHTWREAFEDARLRA